MLLLWVLTVLAWPSKEGVRRSWVWLAFEAGQEVKIRLDRQRCTIREVKLTHVEYLGHHV
jgi:hypothetical protein